MRIGELAQATRTQVQTIRYYESEGLLPAPARSSSNYRVYGPTHQARLGFIRHCRSLDMTLEEIRTLLSFKDAPGDGNCTAVNELLDAHIGHVAERIRELKALQTELKALRAQCAASGEACGILQSLDRAAPAQRVRGGDAGGHVGRTHGR